MDKLDLGNMHTLGFWRSWWINHGDQLIAAAIKIAVIIAVYYVIRFLVYKVIGRLLYMQVAASSSEARQARVRAMHTVVRSAVGFVMGFVAVIMILQTAGLNILRRKAR